MTQTATLDKTLLKRRPGIDTFAWPPPNRSKSPN